jgi:prepilin-type N-terminal cleavage/methylation domain-containing protein
MEHHPNSHLRTELKSSDCGMTMIELLIAMAVLAIGMGAMVTVFASAISGNGRAKTDTSATMLAQTVLERIAAQPANSAVVITMQDCNSAGAVVWNIATAGAAAPGLGATLITANPPAGYNLGDIDWVNQPYANVAANYKMQFMACGNNGRGIPFDVRWNIQTISANARLITVSARPLAADNGNRLVLYNQPVTLRGIGGI